MRRPLLIATGAFLTILLIAGAADAAVFRGSTSQREQVTLRTDGQGVPTRFWLKKYRAPCRGGAVFRDRGAGSVPPFDRVTDRSLFDKGPPYEIRDGALRLSVLTSVRAKRVSDRRWTGSFRSRIKVTRRGDRINRCRADFRFGMNLLP